jgi:hypothetical protein
VPCRIHAAPMPSPCRPPAALIHTCHAAPMPSPCRVNSHMPCRARAILRQCRVLRESSRGSRKKPNADRSPTCRLWTVDANSHFPAMPCLCNAHAALCLGLEKSLLERHGRGISWARYGICRSNTVSLCKSNEKGTI